MATRVTGYEHICEGSAKAGYRVLNRDFGAMRQEVTSGLHWYVADAQGHISQTESLRLVYCPWCGARLPVAVEATLKEAT